MSRNPASASLSEVPTTTSSKPSRPLIMGPTGSPLAGGFDDVVVGTSDNDALAGLSGADTMAGGLGDDTYYVVGEVVAVTGLVGRSAQRQVLDIGGQHVGRQVRDAT
jgi:Ca2+-binding RTX toxin-like protein